MEVSEAECLWTGWIDSLSFALSLPPLRPFLFRSLLLPIVLSPVIVVAWMSTPARRFARQGRKDDKTTLERVRDTNRGINGGVKEVKRGTPVISAV